MKYRPTTERMGNIIHQLSDQLHTQQIGRELKTVAWIAFWLFVLTWGENDLIGAIVDLINRIG